MFTTETTTYAPRHRWVLSNGLAPAGLPWTLAELDYLEWLRRRWAADFTR